jgi:hypothetical protein
LFSNFFFEVPLVSKREVSLSFPSSAFFSEKKRKPTVGKEASSFFHRKKEEASYPFFIEKRIRRLLIIRLGTFGSVCLFSYKKRPLRSFPPYPKNSQTKPPKNVVFWKASYNKARNLRRRFLPKAPLLEEPFF